MAQNKKFSAIVPIHKENYVTLDDLLFHLKEQDYRNYEVVIAYNTPNLPKAKREVKKILKNFPNISSLEIDAGYDEELGAGNHCRAFNRGAIAATGDYYMFLDPDIRLLPGVLREYKDAFDRHPEAAFVYGDYDFADSAGRVTGRRYNEYELRCANYISGAFPIRREAFKGWDENVKSLQDWDMWYSAIDAGAKGFYLDQKPCFIAEPPKEKGISAEGAEKWKERYAYVREKHGFPVQETVVTSLGAPDHASNAAEILGVDTRVLTNLHIFKPNDYKNVYLVGFYTHSPNASDPQMALRQHVGMFYEGGDLKKAMVPGKKIVHWVGTDIFMLQHLTSWMGVQFITKMLTDPDLDIIHLAEAKHTHDELLELGIQSQIVPLPPKYLPQYPLPLPAKFAVGVYINPTQDMYFEDFMYEVADAMPDVDFKFFGNRNLVRTEANKEWVGWVDMEKFLPTISCMVRLTRHDGLPLGPLEAIMAGRNVLASVPLEHALYEEIKENEPDRASVIEKIRKMQEMGPNIEGAKYWRKELDHNLYRQRISNLLK